MILGAAVCLGFFGFHRAGEMMMPSVESVEPVVHLNQEDIAVDDPQRPELSGWSSNG